MCSNFTKQDGMETSNRRNLDGNGKFYFSL